MDRWYLLTDRKLKGYRLYGPFPTSQDADYLAARLLSQGTIKSWSVIIAEIPPRFTSVPGTPYLTKSGEAVI